MAERKEELRIVIRLDETGKLEANLGGVSKKIRETGDAAGSASGGFAKWQANVVTLNQALEVGRKIYGAISTVVSTVSGVIGSAIEASNQQEEALAALNTTLRSSGQFTEEYSQELQALAGEMQATTKFGDETVLTVEQMLVAMGAAPEQVGRLTRASLDLATGLKGANATASDAASAAQLLGKAVAGEFGTLSRYGIIVDKNASDTEKLNQALEQIEQRFGGQAAAAAETFGGKLTVISNVVGDLQEHLGDAVKQSDFLGDALEEVKDFLLDLNTAAGESKTTLTEFIDAGLRETAIGALKTASVVLALAEAFVILGSKAGAAGKIVLGALSGDPAKAAEGLFALFEDVDTSGFDVLFDRLDELGVKVEQFGRDAPRTLGEGLGGIDLPAGGNGSFTPPPGAAPGGAPRGPRPAAPAGGGGGAGGGIVIPLVASAQEAQLQTEIDRIQRILDSETAHLPTETRMALEAEQARLEQAIGALQPPTVPLEASVPVERLIAKRDEMQSFLNGATLEQAVAIQARVDEYNQRIAELTGQPPPPVAVPVGADTTSADQSIQQSATTAEAAFEGPATKLKQIKDDAGNIKIVADGTEATTAIETVGTNYERLREQFNQDNPKLAINVDEAVEGLVVVTEKGIEVRRELEGVPILVKVNTGDAAQALASLKADAAQSPPPTPIRVDISGAIQAINALREAASRPIVIPVQATGSPTLPISEYFGDYLPEKVTDAAQRASQNEITLRSSMPGSGRDPMFTPTGVLLSAARDLLHARFSTSLPQAIEQQAARRDREAAAAMNKVAGSVDRLGRSIEANTAESRQLRTSIATGTAAGYAAGVIGAGARMGSGRIGWGR